MTDLSHFLVAQHTVYDCALREIENGRKQTHWMWYIFPQLAGLGRSDMAIKYAIANNAEAEAYLAHPVLGARLIEISNALLNVEGKTANEIMGYPDDVKLRSSMTLFSTMLGADDVFKKVLKKYFEGRGDTRTIELRRERMNTCVP